MMYNIKEKTQNNKKQIKKESQKGVTMIALIVTIIVLLILAGVTIAYLTGDSGVINKASDSEIITQVAGVKERVDAYLREQESGRVTNGDFSGDLSVEELKKNNIIFEITTKEGIKLGIIQDLKALGINSKFGKNGKNANDSWNGKEILELEDVFAIDMVDESIYYINNKKIWTVEGNASKEEIADKNTDKTGEAPIVTVTPGTIENLEDNNKIIIKAKAQEGKMLKSTNSYEYYLSKSENSLVGGSWKKYESGKEQTIEVREGNTEYYIFVRRVVDNEGVFSEKNTVLISGTKFHRYGPYVNGNEVITYKIIYNLNGGTANNPGTYARSNPTFKLNNPIKIGYTFIGWTGSNGESPQMEVDIPKGSSGARNYTANYRANTYTVEYDGNGETGGSTEKSIHTYDTAKPLTGNAFTRAYTVTYNYNGNGTANTSATANYTFKNWNSVAGGTGTTYTNGQSVNNLSSTNGSTVTLYAQWTPGAVTLPTPTRTGYTFAGWYTVASGGTKVGSGGASYTPTAGVTLYAQWTANTYTIAYNANGATSGSTANSSHSYDTAKALTANGFARTGYEFIGWGTTNSQTSATYGNGASVNNLTSTNGGTVTLYALWRKTVTVTFYDYTTGTQTRTVTGYMYNAQANVTVTTPAQNVSSGWTIRGWSTANTGNAGITVASGGNITVSNSASYYGLYSKTVTATKYVYNNSASTVAGTAYMNASGAIINASIALGTTSLSGYSPRGWSTVNTANAGITVALNGTASINTNTTYFMSYAYTVTATYYYNNTSTSPTATAYMNYVGIKVGATPTVPANPTSSGWSFRGWSTSTAYNGAVATPGAITGNTTYYGSYQKTVTATKYVYNNSASTATGYAFMNYANTIVNASIALGTTTLAGYTPRGWSTANAANAGITVPVNGTASINTNTTYYMSYTYPVNVYFITATEGTITNIAYPYMNYVGTKVGAAATTPTPGTYTGWTFRGWVTDGNATGTVVTPGATTVETGYMATYYKDISVSFNVNGGTGSVGTVSSRVYINSVGTLSPTTLPTTVPTRSGYTFFGWSTSSTATNATYNAGERYNFSANTTLYAVWSYPYLPTGATVIESDVSKGYTIKDSNGNEWVWVEVPKSIYTTATSKTDYTKIEKDMQTYAEAYRNSKFIDTWYEGCGLTEPEYNTTKNAMLTSVYENGGFYIGRYEVGTQTQRKASGDALSTAVIKQDMYPYNFVTCSQSQTLAKGLATGGRRSSLMYGIQWDLVCKYMEEKGTELGATQAKRQVKIKSDSSTWGNYYNVAFDLTRGKYSTDRGVTFNPVSPSYTKSVNSSVLLTTGATERNKVLNIYDFAGNELEWTLEYTSGASYPCANRGAYYNRQ